MGDLTIHNLDDALIQQLKTDAEVRGKSLEDHVRAVLAAAAVPNRDDRLAALKRIQAMTPNGRSPHDSTDIIRSARDAR